MGRRAWYIKILRLSLNHLRNTVEILDNCWKTKKKQAFYQKNSDISAHLWKVQNYFFNLKKNSKFLKRLAKTLDNF